MAQALINGASQQLIDAQGISIAYHGRTILDNVSLNLESQTITSLIGPNGAGKSTLVRIILGILKPDHGTVRRTSKLKTAYVPQKLNIDQSLPMTVSRFLDLPKRRPAAAKREILAETGMTAREKDSIHTLSGGEFQRLLLARALLDEPDLLVLDEPAQNVDFHGQSELFELITKVRDDRGCAILLVSHELHLVMASTDQVVCLNNHICCRGHPAQISDNPAYRALFGPKAASFAVYRHHHDHHHNLDGTSQPKDDHAA